MVHILCHINFISRHAFTGLRFFTNKHPVPPRIQVAISDDEDDGENSEEVENIEMQPLVEKNWPWKIITTV